MTTGDSKHIDQSIEALDRAARTYMDLWSAFVSIHDGGQIQVSVEKSPRRRKRGSQVEKALEDQEVSASDDPAAAAHVTQEVKDSRSKRSTKSEEAEKH